MSDGLFAVREQLAAAVHARQGARERSDKLQQDVDAVEAQAHATRQTHTHADTQLTAARNARAAALEAVQALPRECCGSQHAVDSAEAAYLSYERDMEAMRACEAPPCSAGDNVSAGRAAEELQDRWMAAFEAANEARQARELHVALADANAAVKQAEAHLADATASRDQASSSLQELQRRAEAAAAGVAECKARVAAAQRQLLCRARCEAGADAPQAPAAKVARTSGVHCLLGISATSRACRNS